MKYLAAFCLFLVVWWSPAFEADAAEGACVTHPEFMQAPFAHRKVVEKSWDAGGRKGVGTVWTNPHWFNVRYKSCTPGGFVDVAYRKTTRQAQAFLEFKETA